MNQNQHVKTLWPCFSLSIWSRGMFFMFHDYDLMQEGLLHQGYVVQPNLCWQLHPFVSCLESFIVLHGALITKHAWAPRTAQVQMYFVTINLWVHFTCIYYYSLLVSSYHRNQVSTFNWQWNRQRLPFDTSHLLVVHIEHIWTQIGMVMDAECQCTPYPAWSIPYAILQ